MRGPLGNGNAGTGKGTALAGVTREKHAVKALRYLITSFTYFTCVTHFYVSKR